MLRIHESKGKVIITTGRGWGSTALASFDHAELDANILALNAVRFSSFIPPGWEVHADNSFLLEHTHSGRCLPMAYEYKHSLTEVVAAAVAVGIPKDQSKPCIIMEHTSEKKSARILLAEAEKSVREVFGFRNWQLEKIVSKSVEASPKHNKYACVLAAAVYIPE